MNRLGQRLGTADQTVVLNNGPWYWQCCALIDTRCVLIREFRKAEFRNEVGPYARVLWLEEERIPRYPHRRPPLLAPSPSMSTAVREAEEFEYEREYLAGIPFVGTEDHGRGLAPLSSHGAESGTDASQRAFLFGWNHL